MLLAVPESEAEINELKNYLTNVAQALSERGFKVEFEVKGSGPARTLLEVSREEGFDLIMMASRGRGSAAPHDGVGSVAEHLMETTICPVFLVPVQTSRGIRGLPYSQSSQPKIAGSIIEKN